MRFSRLSILMLLALSLGLFFSCSKNMGSDGDIINNTCTGADCTPAGDPVIKLEPSTFNLACNMDGSVSATLNITNTGGGELSFTASADKSWISLDTASGVAPASILITVDCAGMAEGSDSGSIKVSDSGSAAFLGANISLIINGQPPDPVSKPLADDFIYQQFGTPQNDISQAVAVNDSTGDFYIAGKTEGALAMGATAGANDIFLVKYNSDMTRQWIKQWGTVTAEHIEQIMLDEGGNIYLLGTTGGDLDNDSDFHMGTDANDFFLAKYDSDGNMIWTEQIESVGNDYSGGMAFDNSGNIYVTGYTQGILPGHTSLGGDDIFLFKFGPSGNILDSKQFGTSSNDRGVAVVVDSSNNAYMIGRSSGAYDGQVNLGSYDIVITKFAHDGFKIFSRQYGTSYSDRPIDAEIDSNNDIVIIGDASTDFMGNPEIGSGDIFVFKTNSDGEVQWSDLIGSTNDDADGRIAIDSNDDIFIAGKTSGDFDGNTLVGGTDIFLTRYDSSGTRLYSTQIGSDGYDYVEAIDVDSQGNLYITGYTDDEFDVFTGAGYNDIFVLKLPFDY